MSNLSKNRSTTKYCVLHNVMITWNSLYSRCIKSQRILFDVQKQGTKFVSRKILGNVDAESQYDFFDIQHLLFFKCNCFRF